MGLAAGRTMAMGDRAPRSIDLARDRTAKAATCQHNQTLHARICTSRLHEHALNGGHGVARRGDERLPDFWPQPVHNMCDCERMDLIEPVKSYYRDQHRRSPLMSRVQTKLRDEQ